MDAEEVLSRINQAALKEAPELDLSGLGLKSLPLEVGNLTNLTFLDLEHNELTALPSEIGYLTNLTGLGLAGNQLTRLPPEIVELLTHPPWRTHSVTFPKPRGSSPTLLAVIRVHSALSCLMAEGHELGTRKLAQSRTAQQLTSHGSKLLHIGSIAWLKRLA